MGRQGVVSTAHWFASFEGARVLRDGGNAFDAAVVAAAVVSVAEPYMSGLGGTGGAVCYHADSGACQALDFHGCAPRAATPDQWRGQDDFIDGMRGALVPGVVAGWAALLERYGTFDFADALAPAIAHAEAGVPVSILASSLIAASADRLARDRHAAAVFLRDGKALPPGSVFVQEQLAETLKTLSAQGARDFYEGSIADAIVTACAENGGLVTHEDLAATQGEWDDTATCAYRGHAVHTLPPPYASFQVLETLRLLEDTDLAALGHHSVEHLHTLIEAIKLARADRIRPPVQNGVPDWRQLLSPAHIADRRNAIDMTRAATTAGDWYASGALHDALGAGAYGPQHTTHLVSADAHGNLVSLTQTLGWLFGGAAMAGETGIFVNDMCYWFDLDPESPNVIGPGKKMGSPIAPVVALSPDGSSGMALGTPGGHGILQTTVQLLSNVLDFGMNLQAAVEAPRIRVDEGVYVAVESRVPDAVMLELGRLGHQCDDVGEWLVEPKDGRADIGRGAVVFLDRSAGVAFGGSDARGDGYALTA